MIGPTGPIFEADAVFSQYIPRKDEHRIHMVFSSLYYSVRMVTYPLIYIKVRISPPMGPLSSLANLT